MAARRNRVTAPELEQFIVIEVCLTGRNLGTGAYGAVDEATIPGATIAAKKLHPELVNLGSPEQVRKWTSEFVEECKLMSKLRHPHVVQFLGISYFPDSHLPVLLMEKLQTSLDSLLETTPNIPLDVKVYLLTGTGRGVVYLHSRTPPVIHRDLTARNILIDSGLTAKIADLGVARMVNIQPGQRAATMTEGPGNGLYMPPEAVPGEDVARYNTSIDIFSFGVVGLFTLTQTFPKNLKGATYLDPTTRKLVARSEIERRADYIEPMKAALGDAHPLVKMTLDCLEYDPQLRPSAVEVLTRLEEVGSTVPQSCTETKLELIQRISEFNEEIQQVRAEVREQVQAEVREQVQKEHQRQLTEQQAQVEQLRREHQREKEQLETTNNQLQRANKELQTAQNQQQAHIEHLQAANNELQTTHNKQQAHLQAASGRLQADKQEQVDGVEELTAIQQQLEFQCGELEQLSGELTSLPLEGPVHQPQGAEQREVPEPEPRKTTSQGTQADTADTTPTRPHPQAKPLLRPAVPSSITFNWKRCEDSSRSLDSQPVALNGKLYARGHSQMTKIATVLQYNPDGDQWNVLPPPPVNDFTIATLKGQLVIVGGKDKSTRKRTNIVLTFNERSLQWVQSYPAMPTALVEPAVVGCQDHLIVAGGVNSRGSTVTANVLNTSTNEWITAEPLPEKEIYKAVLVEEAVYLVGARRVLRAHVPTLISRARSGVWESLPDNPFIESNPVAVDNTLLTVGGFLQPATPTTIIAMYDPTKSQWIGVGYLPEKMRDIVCTVVSGQLIVLGRYLLSKSVYVAELSIVY